MSLHLRLGWVGLFVPVQSEIEPVDELPERCELLLGQHYRMRTTVTRLRYDIKFDRLSQLIEQRVELPLCV